MKGTDLLLRRRRERAERAEDEHWARMGQWLKQRAEQLDEEWANDTEYRPWED